MPVNGETKLEYFTWSEGDLLKVINKYNAILANPALDIVAAVNTAAGLLGFVSGIAGVVLAVPTVGIMSVGLTAGYTASVLVSQAKAELALFQKHYNAVTGTPMYNAVKFTQKFTYKRTKMGGDYFEAWYSSTPEFNRYTAE